MIALLNLHPPYGGSVGLGQPQCVGGGDGFHPHPGPGGDAGGEGGFHPCVGGVGGG